MLVYTLKSQCMYWKKETAWCIDPAYLTQVAMKTPEPQKTVRGTQKTAIVPIFGVMVRTAPASDAMMFGLCDMEQVVTRLRTLRKDPSVEKIVLAIDSPGGTANYANVLADEVWQTAKEKEVIALAMNYCCSAAYYVASQASRIYIESETTLLGSLGAIIRHVAFTDTQVTAVTNTGAEAKAAMSGGKPTPEEISVVRERLDQLGGIFTSILKRGRNVAPAALTGQAFYGSAAIKVKLADGFSTLEELLKTPEKPANPEPTKAQLAALSPSELQTYTALRDGQDPYRFCFCERDKRLVDTHLTKLRNIFPNLR